MKLPLFNFKVRILSIMLKLMPNKKACLILSLLCVAISVAFVCLGHYYLIKHNNVIYVVNIDKIYEKSMVAEKGKEHLALVVQTLKSGLKQAESIYGEKGTHPSNEIMQRGSMKIESQYKNEINKINKIVDETLISAIHTWLLKNKDALIVTNTLFLGYGDSTDITTDIIKIMDKEEIIYPDLPKVFIEK